jgi:tetratricopeptide (TPR) repeat protein
VRSACRPSALLYDRTDLIHEECTMSRSSRVAASFVLAFALVASSVAHAGNATSVGEVAFANSGVAAAQPAFLRGLALLHNFEYPDAAESFRAAQKADPGFAMAYWGEAMTYTHPVWMQQDRDAAVAVLTRLGPTPAERAAKAPTARERGYLHAIEVLYGEGTKEQRDVDYAAAMAAVHASYPDDVDATAFYALALLGTAHEGRDFTTYMRAAALLEEVFPTHQHHPGVLHYLIHCYDDAVHAPLGLRAARLYGAVAPDAGHALHMTSHIFIALGQWDDVIAANEQAMTVVDHHLHEKGKAPARCGHYANWLHYAFLQVGRTADANRILEGCGKEAAEELSKTDAGDSQYTSVDSYAEMRLQHLVDAGSTPAWTLELPKEGLAATRFTLAYTDALILTRTGTPAKATMAAAALHETAGQVASAAQMAGMSAAVLGAAATVVDQQVEALALLRHGKRDDALATLEKAAATEDAIPLTFGPPTVEKPTRELLGEELLAAGRHADAARAFQGVLARAPGRTTALQGLLKAQKALGDSAGAAATQATLDRNLGKAKSDKSSAASSSAATP